MKANVFMDGVRGFFSIIDGAIYSLISNVYELLLTLAKTSIFSEQNIRDFATRIYAFLGIIMLFKVTFSLISYLVNPDAISDKTKGAGNVAKNIIVTLFLIIIVPFGFDLLYQAQSAIINDELIPRLILGTKEDTLSGLSLVIDTEACKKADNEDKVIPTAEITSNGDYIGLMAFRPFYQVYDDAVEEIKGDEDFQLDYCSVSNVSQLLEGKNKNHGGILWVFGDKYYINYQFFISTAVGVLILLLLINFTFDIAVRTIKLGFLEIVAPIPIISYIDPKASKDGPFKKWLNEVMKTWVSLFLRLIVVFFAIYIIQVINENLKDLTDQGMWVMLFLIIGALMFAKQAIPLIEKVFGVKFDHTVQLNPFKKVSDQALGGKAVVGLPGKALATGLAGGLALGGAVRGHRLKTKDIRENSKNLTNEEKRLQNLRNKMRLSVSNYKRLDAANPTVADKINSREALGAARSRAIQSGYAVKEQEDRVNIAKASLEKARNDYNEKNSDKEGNLYFSEKSPILAGIMQTLNGAKVGFDSKETANIARAVTEGINAARKAAKRTNDFNKFGFMDRLKDLGTDLTGVKNESGTTSIVKKEIKEQTECLNNIKNAINSLEHSFGNLKPGAINYDPNGRMSANTTGNYHYDVGEREQIESLINQYESLRASEKAVTKQIKEYEEVLEINKPKAK